jgi:membrane protein implicated in regulation of membrane protease activity
MSFLDDLGYQWWWLLAAAILGILEIFVPGIFLVWMALAAGVTGLLVLIMPNLPLGVQLGIFALLAFSAVYSGRRYYERNPVGSSDPNLNERTARLIGKTVTVETAIHNGRGRVKIGDSLWIAQGADAAAGSQVVVVSADGSCLTVAPEGEV